MSGYKVLRIVPRLTTRKAVPRVRYVGTVAVAIAAVALPAVALADSSMPVDLQISTAQPHKVGLGETFVLGVTVGINPAGPMDPGKFPQSWSLTWAVTFP